MVTAQSRSAVSRSPEFQSPEFYAAIPRPRLTVIPGAPPAPGVAQVTGPAPAPAPATAPGLRLTRRGRIVVACAAALLTIVLPAVLLAVLLAVGAGSAQATSHAISRGAAERDLTQVTVRPGQSLWSVAETVDPDADPRVVTQKIIELNALTGTVVTPGERLWVPRE